LEITFSSFFIFDATIDWYTELKKDYSQSLSSFHVINYIRHDFYNRGISEIHFINSKRFFFYEIVDGKKKKVTYRILNTKDDTILIKREVSGTRGKKGVNYLGPYKMELEFENSKDFVILKSSIGNFILPKSISNREFILGINLK